MQDDLTLPALERIMSATGISYTEVASASGAAPTTVRVCLLTRTMPARAAARAKLRAFVAANSAAKRREDIRFAP